MTFYLLYLLLSLVVVASFFALNFKVPLSVRRLNSVTPLYSDRTYMIRGGHRLIGRALVIPIGRHMKTPIYLTLGSPATVYRLLSEVNDNTAFAEWTVDPESIYAPGSDYAGNQNNLTRAVFRNLTQGVHRLPSGGPRFASPILLEPPTSDASSLVVEAHTVRPFNKIIGGPRRSKKKLLAALAFVVATNLAAAWLHGWLS